MFEPRPCSLAHDDLRLVPRWRTPIWILGELPPRPRVAIVGSRAVRHGLVDAIDPIVEVCGCLGMSVVSGGAVGVDAAVHRSALRRAVGQVAVLPGAPDRPYPPDHTEMFTAIAAAGSSALAFLHPAGTEYARGMFASRNRVVVGWADFVIIIAAGLRSGTRGTAGIAAKQGRPVAAVPGTAGAAACIADGAVSLGLTGASKGAVADAVRDFLTDRPGASVRWPDRLRSLADALEGTESGLCIDDFPNPLEAAVGLVEAEALGLIVEVAPGRYVLSSRPSSPRTP